MIIHIKNITAEHLVIKHFLLGIGLKNYIVNKDTYTISDATEQQYQEIVDLAKELGAVNKVIIIKKNGL
jgi:hypothetical protein